MCAAAFVGYVWTTVDAARTKREIAYQQAQQRCAGATNTDCQELATAIRSAVAAEDAATFAAQQLWLNLLGLFGLSATVLFAAFAWREAQRSADAAHETLNDARSDAAAQEQRFRDQMDQTSDTVRKQLRAYVYPESLTFIWHNDGHPLFTITLRNSGLTPAINVRVGGEASFGGVGYFPPVPPDLKLGRRAFLGQNKPVRTTLMVAGYKTIRSDMLSEATMLHVMGRVEYDDVFGDTYQTEFGYYAFRPDMGKGMAIVAGHRPAFRKIAKPK